MILKSSGKDFAQLVRHLQTFELLSCRARRHFCPLLLSVNQARFVRPVFRHDEDHLVTVAVFTHANPILPIL